MAEKEYIERGAALCAVTDNRIVITDDIISLILAVAQKNIRRIPAADVVEVVRCKDCEYWQDNNGGYPHKECRWGKDETPYSTDFCSYGKRKEETT